MRGQRASRAAGARVLSGRGLFECRLPTTSKEARRSRASASLEQPSGLCQPRALGVCYELSVSEPTWRPAAKGSQLGSGTATGHAMPGGRGRRVSRQLLAVTFGPM